jgi:hypothetical protein
MLPRKECTVPVFRPLWKRARERLTVNELALRRFQQFVHCIIQSLTRSNWNAET